MSIALEIFFKSLILIPNSCSILNIPSKCCLKHMGSTRCFIYASYMRLPFTCPWEIQVNFLIAVIYKHRNFCRGMWETRGHSDLFSFSLLVYWSTLWVLRLCPHHSLKFSLVKEHLMASLTTPSGHFECSSYFPLNDIWDLWWSLYLDTFCSITTLTPAFTSCLLWLHLTHLLAMLSWPISLELLFSFLTSTCSYFFKPLLPFRIPLMGTWLLIAPKA